MNILQVIPYFTPKRGGDVDVCYNISKNLSILGHKVTIITTNFEYDKEYADSLKNVRIIPFKSVFNFNLFIYSPDMGKWLEKNCKHFDVVHLHGLRSYQNNLIFKYVKVYSIPYVVQPHGTTSRVIGNKMYKLLYDFFYGKKILENANKVIAVSKEESLDDNDLGAENRNIEVIYNGINIEKYSLLPEKGTFKNKYSINKSFILYLGRIHKLKGLDFLVKSFNYLSNDINDVLLVIAGSDDGFKSNLIKLINKYELEDKIIFTGFLNEYDKICALKDADIFIHAVQYMGGVALIPLEAILCETPVIVTEGCGEIIKDINSGYFVEYGNVNQLKNKMKQILNNPIEGQKLAIEGKKIIQENYNWNKVVLKVEKTLKEAILENDR